MANAGNRWDSQESMCTKIINYESWTNDVTMEDVWCFMVLLWRNAPDESRVANCAGCSSIRPRLPLSSGQALEERKQAFYTDALFVCLCVFFCLLTLRCHVRVGESRFKSCLLQGSLKQKKNTLKKLKEIDAIEALFHGRFMRPMAMQMLNVEKNMKACDI